MSSDPFLDGQVYVKCPMSNKCILRAQMCNGIVDCPGQDDEINCSKDDCRKLGKTKCPNESKCIEDSFACRDSGKWESYYSRNKCKYNMDCIQNCLEQEEDRFFCPQSSPSTTKAQWMKDNCPYVNQVCNKPDLEFMEFFKSKIFNSFLLG